MSTELILFLVMLCFRSSLFDVPGLCGMDHSSSLKIQEGSSLDRYPWLGRLYYPTVNEEMAAIVVLITKEMVIGSAFDIDKYPKVDFRAKAKVILGSNCSGQQIGVKDYSYHPDYQDRTLSALAMVLLDVTHVKTGLHPICKPPIIIDTPDFYAMILSRDCRRSTVKVFEMEYVDPEECRTFYRRTELDVESMWPTHTACAKALWGGKCVWRNGAVLMLRQHGRWSLVGIGVYGPGCESPARFLDYRMSHAWVRATIARIGTPALTRMGPDEIIVRRLTSSMQRFGQCDEEETQAQIYTEETIVNPKLSTTNVATYNLTLFTNVDYTCILLRVTDLATHVVRPRISLRRWCSTPMPACYESHHLQVDFHVEIQFSSLIKYEVWAYGRRARLIDRKALMVYANMKRQRMTIHPLFMGYWAPIYGK